MKKLFSFVLMVCMLMPVASLGQDVPRTKLRAGALRMVGVPAENSSVKVSRPLYVFNVKVARNYAHTWQTYPWYSATSHSNATTYAALMESDREEAKQYAAGLVEMDEAFVVPKGKIIVVKKIYIRDEPMQPFVQKERGDAFKSRTKLREYNTKMVEAAKRGYAWVEVVGSDEGKAYGIVRLLDLKGMSRK